MDVRESTVVDQRRKFREDLEALCDRSVDSGFAYLPVIGTPSVNDILELLASFEFELDRLKTQVLIDIYGGEDKAPWLVERLELAEEAARLRLTLADVLYVRLSSNGNPVWVSYRPGLDALLTWW